MSFCKKTTDRRSRKNRDKLARLGDLASRQHRLRLEPLEDRRMLSVLHVDADVLAGGNGLAWESAYGDLQSALDRAELLNADEIATNDINQIWIAEGTYKPAKLLEAENARTASFSLLNNVALYGGFEGSETALDQRDWTAHETILSGDLGIQDDISDNAYTVVFCGDIIETTLDGITVIGGNAADMSSDSNGLERKSGGGILNVGILTVSNSIVSDNLAKFCGGGIYNAANLTVANSTVFANSALNGGGIFSSGDLTIHDSTLSGNSATGTGGGIISLGNLTAVNIMVAENSAEDGGGLYTQGDNSTIDNSTIMSNRSRGKTCYGGGIFTSGNLAVTNSIVSNNFTTSRVDGSKAYGGGVYNSGALVVTDSTIANNFCTSSGFRSYSRGGGIYNNGCLTVSNSSIHRNTAQGDCYTFYSGGLGGGIFNNGNLTVSHATLSENFAEEFAGGICNFEEMTVSYSTFFNNSADQSGGAISNYCNMTVTGSLFQGNRSGQDGGAIANLQSAEMMTVSDSTFIGNFAEIGGGGIHNWGKGTVSDSTFTDNRTNGHGGAIGNPGTLDLSGLMVSGNYSSGIRWRGNYIDCYMGVGGGISNEMTMTITNSTIVDNFARYGGGMGNISGGSLTVANSTISDNTAEIYGGGVYGSGTTIFHATIIGNVAGRDGGGIYDVERIGNTVIAGNIAPEHPDINVSISDINFVGTEDGDPMLTAITDEMGRLLYYRPQSGSPLIDAGRVFQYTPGRYRIKLDYDQLGNLRLTDPPPAAVDIGSIELQATPELAVTPSPYFEIHEGESITIDVCLTAVPEGTIEVAIEKQADSSDEITADLSTILFDTTNWNIPQTLTLSMAGEVDPGSGQSAVFNVFAPDMETVRLFLAKPTDSQTYVVTSLADVVAEDGQITLREAMEAANTNEAVGDALPGSDSQEDIITFDPALFAEGSATITLSGTQLEITDHLIISGPGEELLTIDANALSRLFYVDHFASATLEGLTLTGGAAEDGGAIFGFGMSLTINECTISKNSAKDYGGGVLFAGAQLIVNDSAVCENSASSGGGIYIDKSIAKINDSLLMGNLATGFNGGGGISSDGLLTLTGSTIRENSAIKDYAGGILNAGQMAISFSSICKNFSSGSGGGIHNGGSLTVTDSLISENVSSSSEGGGGIYNGTQMTVTGSTIHGNSTKSGNGGGIFNRYGQFTVINSTICGNSAENGNGGGISTADLSYYPLSIINSTIAGNVAMDGGGIFQYENITLNNSIVALNEGGQIGGIGEAPGSHNLLDTDPAFIRNPSDGGDGWGDNPDTPDIDESANDDYGDLRLRSDSPAIDAGDNTLAIDPDENPLTTDLDGNPRIFGGTVDIGAYESDVNAPPHVVEVTIGQGNERSVIRRIDVSFHEAVMDLLNADALQLSNLTTGEAISADAITVEVDSITSTATWTFPGLPGGRLPDGNYSATILADAVIDSTGNPMAADYTFEFHSFFGDSDGDRDVDFADLFRFRKTYQKTSADVGFDSRFDTDADGDVDAADLFAFRQNYLKALDSTPSTGSPIEVTAPILSRMQQAALLPFLTAKNTTPPEITYGPVQRPAERGVRISHNFFASRVGLPEPVSQEPLTANSTLDEGLLTTLAMDLQQRQSNTKKSDERASEEEKLLAVAYMDL